ncbi:MAG: hypothetical protein U1D30_25820 [Planctomycetota bacterium]
MFRVIGWLRRPSRAMFRWTGRVLILILVAELLIRGTVWWTGSHDVCQSDPVMGWRLKPGVSTIFGSADGPYLYESNSRGLRDREYALEAPTGRHRVAVLGASTVFGDGVDQSKMFSEVLERHWGDTDVVNVSMPGSSIDQHWLMLRELALPLHPDVVVHFLVQTDGTDFLWPWQFSSNRRKCWVSVKDGTVAINPPDQGFLPRIIESSYVCMGGLAVTLHLLLSTDADLNTIDAFMAWQHRVLARQQLTRAERVEAALQILRATKSLCQKNGCEYVTAYLPSKNELEGKVAAEARLVREEVLDRFHREDGVLVIDALAGQSSSLDANAAEKIFAEYHLNVKGHELVSENLALALETALGGSQGTQGRRRTRGNQETPLSNEGEWMSQQSTAVTPRTVSDRDAVLSSVLRAFWKGLVQPGRTSVATAIVVASTASVFFANCIDESWMLRHGDWFAAGDEDANARVTRRALELRSNATNKTLLVFAGDEISLAPVPNMGETQVLRGLAGDGCEFVDLRAPSQTLYESFSLLDQIPSSTSGRVVILVTPEMFTASEDAVSEMANRSKIGVRSASATIDMMRQGVTIVPLRGNYFVDNQAYLLSRAPVVATHAMNFVAGRVLFDPARQRVEKTTTPTVAKNMDRGSTSRKLESLGRLLDRLAFLGFDRTVVVMHSGMELQETEFGLALRELVQHRKGTVLWSVASSDSPSAVAPRVVADLKELLRGSDGGGR